MSGQTEELDFGELANFVDIDAEFFVVQEFNDWIGKEGGEWFCDFSDFHGSLEEAEFAVKEFVDPESESLTRIVRVKVVGLDVVKETDNRPMVQTELFR